MKLLLAGNPNGEKRHFREADRGQRSSPIILDNGHLHKVI